MFSQQQRQQQPMMCYYVFPYSNQMMIPMDSKGQMTMGFPQSFPVWPNFEQNKVPKDFNNMQNLTMGYGYMNPYYPNCFIPQNNNNEQGTINNKNAK